MKLDDKLELLAELLLIARELVDVLATGETVETDRDADAAIADAKDATKRLAVLLVAAAEEE